MIIIIIMIEDLVDELWNGYVLLPDTFAKVESMPCLFGNCSQNAPDVPLP